MPTDSDPRPSRDEYGLDLAKSASKRADCTRRLVGAALMRSDHTIAGTGYNGAPAGDPGCLTAGACPRGRASTEEVPGYDQPGASSYDVGPGSCIAIHAEMNVCLRASWPDMLGATLYVTDKPCPGCTRMIAATPIYRVVWPDGEYTKRGIQ